MSFVRPEARAALWRWREVRRRAGWPRSGCGGLGWRDPALAGIRGAADAQAVLTIMGVQRARFRHGGGGPGVVRVDEGQVAYFGPLTGGVVAIRDLDSLTLDPSGHPRIGCSASAARPICTFP